MQTAASFIGLLLALAFLVESTTEYIFGPFLDKTYIRYVALAVGVAVCVLFGIDALKEFFGLAANLPFVGSVATGLIIGRGASFLHDFYGQYIKPEAPPAG